MKTEVEREVGCPRAAILRRRHARRRAPRRPVGGPALLRRRTRVRAELRGQHLLRRRRAPGAGRARGAGSSASGCIPSIRETSPRARAATGASPASEPYDDKRSYLGAQRDSAGPPARELPDRAAGRGGASRHQGLPFLPARFLPVRGHDRRPGKHHSVSPHRWTVGLDRLSKEAVPLSHRVRRARHFRPRAGERLGQPGVAGEADLARASDEPRGDHHARS